MSRLENGESVDLQPYYDNLSRRDFLSIAGGLAATSLGLPELVERAYGATPEGKVIVNKRDREGRPAVVESVHPERYRRLKLFENFSTKQIKHPHIAGASIRQRSSDRTDLALQIGVEADAMHRSVGKREHPAGSNAGQARGHGNPPKPEDIPDVANVPEDPRDLPGLGPAVQRGVRGQAASVSAADIPIEYTIVGGNPVRHGLKGGSSVYEEGNGEYPGTAGLVCYDEGSREPVVLTAYHIGDGDWIYYNGNRIDNIKHYDKYGDGNRTYGQDAVTYSLSSEGIDYDISETINIPDIKGYWTYSGLENETSTLLSNLSAKFYGAESGEVSHTIDDVHKEGPSGIKYAAHTEKLVTKEGDSGGPWVDDDGYLFGIHNGEDGWDNLTNYAVVSVADKTLDAVNATLSPEERY